MQLKKIFLINPFPYYASGINEATIYPPLGLAYIAAFVRQYGFECKILDANVLRLTNDKVIKQLKEFDPDLVGVSTNIVTARAGIELLRQIKKEMPEKITVVGGPFASALPEKVLLTSNADFVVRGEGEETMLELLQKFPEIREIKGLTFYEKVNGKKKVIHNPPRELIKNLDMLPFPAYDLLPDIRTYWGRLRAFPMAPLLSSRGCPYGCIYCNKNIFGRIFRPRSAENVVEEIKFLALNLGAKQIDVLDDNFTLDLARTEKIFDLLLKENLNLAINLQNGVRADRLTESLVKKMKKAGVFKAGIGIECGDIEMLKIIKKNLDLNAVIRAIKWFRKENILTVGFFMLGLPFETEKTMQKTIDFAIKANPHIANFSVTIPLPGTELYDIISQKGKFLQDIEEGFTTGFYGDEFYFEFPGLNKEIVLKYQRKAYREFYFRPTKIFDILTQIKSFNELKWTIQAALPLLKNILKGNPIKVYPNVESQEFN